MKTADINWDAIELLPSFRCCVCAAESVPWGRTPDDRYFCSKRCGEAHEGARRMAELPARPVQLQEGGRVDEELHRRSSPYLPCRRKRERWVVPSRRNQTERF